MNEISENEYIRSKNILDDFLRIYNNHVFAMPDGCIGGTDYMEKYDLSSKIDV